MNIPGLITDWSGIFTLLSPSDDAAARGGAVFAEVARGQLKRDLAWFVSLLRDRKEGVA